VREALEKGQFSAAVSTVLGKGRHQNDRTATDPLEDAKASGAGLKVPERDVGAPRAGANTAPPADLVKSAEKLEKALEPELKRQQVAVRLEPRGLVISLREAGFFASGDDAVSASSLPALGKIAAVVGSLPNPVRLEGHTDSLPIHNSRFRSNWELSTARAIATLELLGDRYHIPRPRMAVAGYAENVPADSNDTMEGRAHNRRVDIVLLTAEGLRAEPAAATPGPTPLRAAPQAAPPPASFTTKQTPTRRTSSDDR
jgi:chemotaxis protein MotB